MIRRILLVNTTLATRTGTEVVTRDLALGLRGRGHRISVYSPAHGPIADELRAAGVTVVNRLDDLQESPDLIQGHHFVETVNALNTFPDTPGVFVCHDRTGAHSIPPKLSQIRRYVAVDENCLERIRQDWEIPAASVRTILNAVDLSRFGTRRTLPDRPARALAFGSYSSPTAHLEVVRDACDREGLQLDIIGAGANEETARPEELLRQYDLVFAKARCALEALAAGAAVVLCAEAGLGPMVTRGEVAQLRQWNFGARLLRDSLDTNGLRREIARYDPTDAAEVTQFVRQDASMSEALDQYEALYDEVIAEWTTVPHEGLDWRARTSEIAGRLTHRIALLERELAALRRDERMLPLSDASIEAIRISLMNAPTTARAGSSIRIRTRLHNGSDALLGTWAPFPLQWGYRWRAPDEPEFADAECRRTRLIVPVAPGGSGEFLVDVAVPAAPGSLVLRVTLIQEELRWLDRAATPVYADTPVVITE